MTGPWTAKDVENRLLEAMQTQMMMPRVELGRGLKSGTWPDYVLRYPERRVRVRPSAHDVSRMEEALGWINNYLAESERNTFYAWLYFKSHRGRTVSEYAEKSGMNSRTLRRAITAFCQAIANSLNKNNHPLKVSDIDHVSDLRAQGAADSVVATRPQKAPRYIRDDKPVGDTSPEGIAATERLIKKIRKRLRKQRRKNHPKKR